MLLIFKPLVIKKYSIKAFILLDQHKYLLIT